MFASVNISTYVLMRCLNPLGHGVLDPQGTAVAALYQFLAPYVKKYAKRNGTTLETAGLRFASDEAMEAAGYSSDLPVYYMPLSEEIKKMYRKPIPTYAMGGGVASMAPVATNMFRGYDDVRRGVGSYAPLIRRA